MENSEPRTAQDDSFGIGTINNFKCQGLTHAEFNQDQTCFIYTFNNEFCVWDCENLQVRYTKVFKRNLGRATVLYKTNIVILSSGAGIADPLINPSSAFIWDDHNNKFIAELNFNDEVVNVKVLRKYIVVVLRRGVYVYELNGLNVIESFDTQLNPDGLCAISDGEVHLVPGAIGMGGAEERVSLVAFPGNSVGEVSLYNVGDGSIINIKAHQSELGGLALNRSGSLLATASERGTLIRVFDTATGEMKFEFRRGTTPAKINNLGFNTKSDLLCATSYKGKGVGGTVHVYRLDEKSQNRYYLKSFGFSGLDYSTGRIYLKQVTGNYLCGFDRNTNNLIVLSYDGVCYRYTLGSDNDVPTVSKLNSSLDRRDKEKEKKDARNLNYSLGETVRVIPMIS